MNRKKWTTKSARDVGVTLPELVITIALMGVVVLALTVSVTTVLRTEKGVATRVDAANDIQQAVNYLPADVQRAPAELAAFEVGASGAVLCSGGSGANVLSVAYPAGGSVSYVMSAMEDDGSVNLTASPDFRLDRFECDAGGGVVARVRIADHLSDEGSPPAAASLESVGSTVTRIRLELNQEVDRTPQHVPVFRVNEVSASPMVGEELPPIPPPPSSSGGSCSSNNPLDDSLGFLTFVEGDVHISHTQVYKALGVGGSFSFNNGQIAGHGGHPGFTPADVGLYATRVDWANSSGEVQINGSPKGHVVLIDDEEGVHVSTDKQANIMFIRAPGSTSTPQIKAQNGNLKKAAPGYAVNFPNQFANLRACAEQLALLPSSCTTCAVHVAPLHVNSNSSNLIPYGGSGNLKLGLTAGKTNVLNIGEERLPMITNTPSWLNVNPSQTTSIIVNVIDTNGDGEINLQPINFSNYTTKVLWNFYGVDRVNIPGGVWGTIFAPDAHVEAGGNMQGNVVAKSFTHSGSGVVNEANGFNGTVQWD